MPDNEPVDQVEYAPVLLGRQVTPLALVALGVHSQQRRHGVQVQFNIGHGLALCNGSGTVPDLLGQCGRFGPSDQFAAGPVGDLCSECYVLDAVADSLLDEAR